MSNKDLLKQAIAEAKTIREAAIANAKEALEETLTPHLKEMLAQKLQEMDDEDNMEEYGMEHNDIDLNGDGKVDAQDTRLAEAEEEEEEAEEGEEGAEEEGNEEEEELEIEDMSVEDLKDLIRDIVAQEVGNEEAETETGEEAPEGDDMTSVDDSEEIDINELLAELEGMDESSYSKNPKDSDKSGANDGFTNPSKRTPASSKHGNTYQAGAGYKPGRETYTNEGELNEGFEEWLERTSAQLEKFGKENPAIQAIEKAIAAAQEKAKKAGLTGHGMTKGHKVFEQKENLEEGFEEWLERTSAQLEKFGKENPTIQAIERAIAAAQEKAKKAGLTGHGMTKGHKVFEGESEELNEALQTVKTLRNQLQEVNLLNAKLLYVNKVFKSNNLSEGQKVNVIAAFDKAETVKEVKLVFETVSKNVVAKPAALKEHRSFASKATGNAQTTAPKEILSEVSEQVARWQKLAGIIKS